MHSRKWDGRQFLITGCLMLVLAFSLAFSAKAERMGVSFDVTFGQTEAREMLSLINAFRAGSDAWAWNEDDTKKVWYDGSPLTYSKDLEQVAMQRAAELVIQYSHMRPDGTLCFTAGGWGTSKNLYGMMAAENIAVGYRTYESVFAAWQETNQPYDGQGHRRNMLEEGFQSVGIGHVVYEGVDYWVQEFGTLNAPAKEDPLDGKETITVAIDDSEVASVRRVLSNGEPGVTLSFGEEKRLPDIQMTIVLKNGLVLSREVPVSWTCDNPAILQITANGLGKAMGVGETTLSASLPDGPVAYPALVEPKDISAYTFTAMNAVFDGTPKTPKVTLQEAGSYGTVLPEEGSGYSVSYAENIHAGTAWATVTGIGNFQGDVEVPFTIQPVPITGFSIRDIQDQVYTGENLRPEVFVEGFLESSADVTGAGSGGRDVLLSAGLDYEVTYSSNLNVGTALATVVGKGDYQGTLAKGFTILPASLTGATVQGETQVYTGYALTPTVTVTLAGKKLVGNQDYLVEYEDNTEVGQAHLLVNGIGNYQGSAEGYFTIVKITPTPTPPIEPQDLSLAVGSGFVIGSAYHYTVTKAGASGTATVALSLVEPVGKKITVPSTVTFEGCKYVVTAIGSKACIRDSVVTSVTIGSNVKSIGAYAFYGCKKLKSVVIGSRVTTIKKYAFYKDSALKSITIQSKKLTASKMGTKAFSGIYKKASFRVPAKVLETYQTILRKAGAGAKTIFMGM